MSVRLLEGQGCESFTMWLHGQRPADKALCVETTADTVESSLSDEDIDDTVCLVSRSFKRAVLPQPLNA